MSTRMDASPRTWCCSGEKCQRQWVSGAVQSQLSAHESVLVWPDYFVLPSVFMCAHPCEQPTLGQTRSWAGGRRP